MENKNEMITIELTRGELENILMALREVVFEVDAITNNKPPEDCEIDHTFLCYLELDKIVDLYNYVSTLLSYDTKIILIEKETNK